MGEEVKKKKRKSAKVAEAAQTLVSRRWVKEKPTGEEAASASAVVMNRKRWAGTTAKERSAYASWIAKPGQLRGPADPSKKRCPCGRMTLKRAETRAGKHGTSKGHYPGCRFYKAEAEEAA